MRLLRRSDPGLRVWARALTTSAPRRQNADPQKPDDKDNNEKITSLTFKVTFFSLNCRSIDLMVFGGFLLPGVLLDRLRLPFGGPTVHHTPRPEHTGERSVRHLFH